ncbi:MAG: glycosyltransferase family A protein [Candidatus Paceibacterota bacterium]
MNIEYPKISVVIPTCDRLDYLNQSICSVLGQTFSAFEIIIIDNGINCVKKEDLPTDNKIKLIRALPKFGVSQARNTGAVLSKGDYISFLDDDDKWDSQYLEAVSNTILKEKADIILGRLLNMSDGNPLVGKQAEFKSREDLISLILKKNPGAVGSNTTVNRKVFTNSPGYNPFITTNQDKALVLDLLLSNAKVSRADDAWVEFRMDVLGPRQTDLKKRIKGKRRFIQVYWVNMNYYTRVYNLMQLVRLWVNAKLGK